MSVYKPDQYRNIVILGHGGSGKTTLAEAMLFKAGATNRLGSVSEKTSILDYTDEAKEKGGSIDSSLCYFTHKDHHVNVIDTPGAAAFCGPAIGGMAGADVAVITVSAPAGIEVNTRKMFQRAKEYGLGIVVCITKLDAGLGNAEERLEQIRELFGSECAPINLPAKGGGGVVDCLRAASGTSEFSSPKEANTAILEAIVGIDDDLMEKYLGGDMAADQIIPHAARAVAKGGLIPVFFTSATKGVGIGELMDAIVEVCPSPAKAQLRIMRVNGQEKPVSPEGPDFIGQVFKVASDPRSSIKYIGIRALSGKLTSDMTLKTVRESKGVRPGHVQRFMGADHKEIEAGAAGDIFSLAKLDFHIGEVVYTKEGGEIPMPKFPEPMHALALESRSRGDEDKIATALRRFSEEDPCIKFDRTPAGELVLRGINDTHVRAILHRLKANHGIEVDTKPPRIPYRETILGRANDVEYTHKKQTGGAGQYGKVIINVYAAERGEGYEFIDKIFGGAIDQSFRPSVDKGVRAQLAEGVLAGYPVVDVKVELTDGKTHPVDSKDIAFQVAGRNAFKEGFMKAKPILLEPMVNLEVTIPSDNVGDIQGDLASRRGRPVGQEMLPGNLVVIKGVVPLAEIADYSSRLSSITGGQGSYSIEMSHYEQVPSNVQQQIIDDHKRELEEARG